MSGISNIFNNIKSDAKSFSNASLPQSIAKTAAEESSKIGNVLSPKSIGNDAASYKVAQNNKPNMVNDASSYKQGKWKELSNNSDFLKSQHDFIIASKLNPALKLVKNIKGLDFDKRSPVLKDVLFSTATQHGQGGASEVFHNALGDDVSNLTDEEIINKIYEERKKVDKYFNGSSIDTQSKLKNIRFPKENAKALELLKRYQR